MSTVRRFLGGFGGLRRLSAHTPLRVKLMAAMLVLSTVAVVGTSAAATAVLRSYLYNRVDNQLHRFTNNSMPYLTGTASPDSSIFVPRGSGGGNNGDANRPFNRPRFSTTYFAVTRDVNGVEIRRESSQLDVPTAAPRLPATTIAQARNRNGEPFTVRAQNSKQPRWRVMVTPLADGSGSLTLALSLDEVDATLSHLERILGAVGLAVLALTGLGAYVIVRTSLRPLREVEATAEAIAGGDMSRRVPANPVRTEVGRLSHAVNVMLGQIETALKEREESAADAQASEERMRRFITDASHELRTPLTSIRGFAELYRQGAASAPEQIPGLMARIEGEATRMGLLVEDLLLLARLDQQRPLEREPVDLVAIAGDTVMSARAAHPDRTVQVRMLTPDEDPPGVMGDDARLRQIAGNLVTNACTHTPAGTDVRVGVGSVVDQNGRQWALLEVADDGPGLSPQECERVFERFYRTDSSRNRSTGGSGLGLSIVAALVAAHGGNVTVQSEPGAGAIFRVLLPVV
jgi:two-component system OmpR family sensor kinase